MRNADNDSNAYSYSHRNADGDGYIYPNTDRYVYPDSDGDDNCDTYCYRNASYSDTNSHRKACTCATASAESGTAPLILSTRKKHTAPITNPGL